MNERTSHRGGLVLVRATWASWLQHRGFFFLLAFMWMIPPLVALFIWMAAADSDPSGQGMIGGMSRSAFVGYYLLVILVNQLTYSQTNWTVGDNIRAGLITPWLLRPIPPLYHALADEVAGKVVFMVFTLPAAGLLALILRPELHPQPGQALLFLPSLLMAWALRFFWGMWLAELAFWATRADALLMAQDALVFIFSGTLAPVAMLPAALGRLAYVFPFRYMVGFPVEIMTGQLSTSEIYSGLVIQAGWLALAVGLAWLVWRSGVRRYTAVGG